MTIISDKKTLNSLGFEISVTHWKTCLQYEITFSLTLTHLMQFEIPDAVWNNILPQFLIPDTLVTLSYTMKWVVFIQNPRYFTICYYYFKLWPKWEWCGKTRVASYELLVTSWKLKNTNWNSKVRVQIHELRVQIHEFKITSYELNFTSHDFKSTSHEFKSTSYEFESTSSRII